MIYRPLKYFTSLVFILSIIFSCNNDELPVINITKEGSIGWKYKEPCSIVFKEHKDSLILAARIKCRGGYSSRYPKHSYSIELDEKNRLFDLPSDDDWILNANYIDKTFMRHKICYDLFREMDSLNVASETRYVNVKVNNQPQGLYVLMEEIDESTTGLSINDSLAMLFKEPPVFYEKKLDFVQDSLNYYQQKYPKKSVSDKTYYIEEFRDFIFNSSDQAFADSISYWIDINNLIDWQILLLLTNNGDGVMKNFFLYKKNSGTPFRIAIWDFDHSFGRDGDNELNMLERMIDCERSILFKRLMKIPATGYKNKLKKRWLHLRNIDIISNENFKNYIDNNDKVIAKSIEANFKLWPCDSKWYYDNNGYNDEINLMKEFVRLRINQLDEYLENL